MLYEVFPDPDDHYPRWVRGVMFYPDAFLGRSPGHVVDLELVPERFNRHDVTAVSVDHEGVRVGYLAASEAARWHDVLLAANRAAFSVWVHGELDLVDFGDEDRLAPTLFIPLSRRMCELADRFGLGDTITRLLNTVGESVRAEMMESAWRDFPRTLVQKLARHADQFTELTWPTSPPAGIRSRLEAPGVLSPYLKELVLRQRREQAGMDRLEVEQRRAERQAEVERLRAERIRLKEEARQSRLDQVRDGMERGWTNREIGADTGASLHTVGKLKREVRDGETWDDSDEERAAHLYRAREALRLQGLRRAEIGAGLDVPWYTVGKLQREVRGGEAWNHNSDVRAARLDRAREALRLQGQGLSRAEIGQRMSLGMETVITLLRDAKFYADPDSDPSRRRLAAAAAAAMRCGVVRSSFQADQALSKPKAAEAWKDADVLVERSGTSGHPASPVSGQI